MSWFWDYFQQKQINENNQAAGEAKTTAVQTARKIAELEKKVDSLALLCHALFEELQKVSDITEQELRQKMAEIDLRDGQLDKKFNPGNLAKCSECGRLAKSVRTNCFWCGAKLSAQSLL